MYVVLAHRIFIIGINCTFFHEYNTQLCNICPGSMNEREVTYKLCKGFFFAEVILPGFMFIHSILTLYWCSDECIAVETIPLDQIFEEMVEFLKILVTF